MHFYAGIKVAVAVPVEQELIGAKEEGSGAAGGIERGQVAYLRRYFPSDEIAERATDEEVHGRAWRIEAPARLARQSPAVRRGELIRCEGYRLREAVFVDLTEDVERHGGELAGGAG